MNSRTVTNLACLASLLLVAAGFAGAPSDRYVLSAGSADGIGKRYQGREIAQVMGWQAAPWLEREER